MDPYEGDYATNEWISPPNGYADPGQMQGFEEEEYKRNQGPPRKRSRHSRSQGEFANGGGRGHHGGHHHMPASNGGPRRGSPAISKEAEEIAEFLAFLCTNSGSGGIADMVVEARLGKFDDVEEGGAADDEPKERNFTKELKKEDFMHILDFLEHDDKERSFSDRTVFTSEDTRGNLHLTFDTLTSECVEARYKSRDFNLDLPTPYMSYDCQINVSAFDNVNRPKAMPSDYKRKQKIKRWTFYKQRNIWRIDLMEIHSFYTSPRGKRNQAEDGEMETSAEKEAEEAEEEECNEEGLFPDKRNPIFVVRIRLMPEVLSSLVPSDPENLQYIASKFWQTIQFFIGKSAGRSRRVNFGGPPHGFGNNYTHQNHLNAGGSGGGGHHHGGGNSGRSPYLSPGGPHRGGGAHSHSPAHSRSPSLSPSLSPFFSPQQWPSPHAPASSATPPSPLSQITFPDIQLQLVEHQMTEPLRKLCLKLVKGGQETPGSPSFPGALPINFGRRHWKLVQSKEYYVSEKTDGLRYMMLVTKNGVYLVDRSFDFYAIQGFDQLMKLYATQGETLLDGEMVTHQTSHRATYLVFDVLFINGVYYGGQDLSVRLQKLRDLVIVPYRKAIERGLIDKKNHPFTIIGKQFFDKKYTKKVFEHIRKEKRGGEEAFYYHDEKRHHKTDGLIFTPDEPYVPYSNQRLFKWKYLEKNTIDFKLVPARDKGNHNHGESYLLTCRGRTDQGDIECDIAQFVPEDLVKLKLDLQQAGQSLDNLNSDTNVIVECYYDVKRGQWRYCCHRREKQQANYVKVVFSTMLSLAENIGKDEIMYRILRTAKNDDWDNKQQHVVQQQKKRPLNSSSSSSSNSAPQRKESGNSSQTTKEVQQQATIRIDRDALSDNNHNDGVMAMKEDEGELVELPGKNLMDREDAFVSVEGFKEDFMKEEEEEEERNASLRHNLHIVDVKDEQDQEKIEDAKMEDIVVGDFVEAVHMV